MRRSVRWGLLGAVSLAWLACGGEEVVDEGHGTPVTLSAVMAIDFTEEIGATGELVARDHSQIAAEVGGRITEILVPEGQSVEAGTAVLAIDPERRQLERDNSRALRDQARATLRERERDHARVRDLHGRGVASQQQLEGAETALKLARSQMAAAEAQLGVARRALADATVVAPFTGTIAQRFVSRGEFVQPGQQLFELVALDPIEVEFSVPEVDSGRVAEGQEVELQLDPFPDETFAARVSYVSPTIDRTTRTLRVKAELENPEARLRPGLFARVFLGVAQRENLAMIPEESVLQRSDGAVVFRTEDGERAERVLIETGVHHEGMVEVRSGLRAGDLVVARGQARLVDGQRIAPRNPDGTTQHLRNVAEGPDAHAEVGTLP